MDRQPSKQIFYVSEEIRKKDVGRGSKMVFIAKTLTEYNNPSNLKVRERERDQSISRIFFFIYFFQINIHCQNCQHKNFVVTYISIHPHKVCQIRQV